LFPKRFCFSEFSKILFIGVTIMKRSDVNELCDKIQMLLDKRDFGDNIEIKVGGGSFSTNSATIKLEISEVVDGKVITKEAESFAANARIYGLDPEDLGRKFQLGDDVYTVTGLKPRASKYPILATSENNGKSYKFPADTVARQLTACAHMFDNNRS